MALVADSNGTNGEIVESNEGNNTSPSITIDVLDFVVSLTPNKPKAWQTCPVTFTASAKLLPAGKATGSAQYSTPSCGVGATPTLSGNSFTCSYTIPAPSYQASINATYNGATKTAVKSTPAVAVVALVPKVKLYISDANGECACVKDQTGNCTTGGKTTAQIIKGSKARLCWELESINCAAPFP